MAVYKNGSFTKASEQLSTSQPTISEHVRALEKRLGCKLFDRLGRSIKATRKAEILYPKAVAIIEEIDSLEEELVREDKEISGELIIGASSIPGNYILPHIATDFKRNYADISFEIRIADSTTIIDAVLNHELLAGVVGAKISSEKLKFIPFFEDDLILAASARRELGGEISVKKLLNLPFIHREEGSGTRKSIQNFLLKNGVASDQQNTVAYLGSNAAIKEALKADLGVSILSKISIGDELESGKIREIKIKGLSIKRKFYVATLKKRTLPTPYEAFVERLLKSKIGK